MIGLVLLIVTATMLYRFRPPIKTLKLSSVASQDANAYTSYPTWGLSWDADKVIPQVTSQLNMLIYYSPYIKESI
jgi:hypothetical protein